MKIILLASSRMTAPLAIEWICARYPGSTIVVVQSASSPIPVSEPVSTETLSGRTYDAAHNPELVPRLRRIRADLAVVTYNESDEPSYLNVEEFAFAARTTKIIGLDRLLRVYDITPDRFARRRRRAALYTGLSKAAGLAASALFYLALPPLLVLSAIRRKKVYFAMRTQ